MYRTVNLFDGPIAFFDGSMQVRNDKASFWGNYKAKKRALFQDYPRFCEQLKICGHITHKMHNNTPADYGDIDKISKNCCKNRIIMIYYMGGTAPTGILYIDKYPRTAARLPMNGRICTCGAF